MWTPYILVVFFSCTWNGGSTQKMISFEEFLQVGVDATQRSGFQPKYEQNETKWIPFKLGRCNGCGVSSYREVESICVVEKSIKIVVDNKELLTTPAVFKLPDSACENKVKPKLKTFEGCAPPCSSLRLIITGYAGCKCNKTSGTAYSMAKLVCQDQTNSTVELSMCSSLYQENARLYKPKICDFDEVCAQPAKWEVTGWSECSPDHSITQWRLAECKSAGQKMHWSECNGRMPALWRYCARWAVTGFWKYTDCNSSICRRTIKCRRFQSNDHATVPESECAKWHERPKGEGPCNAIGRRRKMRLCKLRESTF